MLAQSQRLWANVKSTLIQCLEVAGLDLENIYDAMYVASELKGPIWHGI